MEPEKPVAGDRIVQGRHILSHYHVCHSRSLRHSPDLYVHSRGLCDCDTSHRNRRIRHARQQFSLCRGNHLTPLTGKTHSQGSIPPRELEGEIGVTIEFGREIPYHRFSFGRFERYGAMVDMQGIMRPEVGKDGFDVLEA